MANSARRRWQWLAEGMAARLRRRRCCKQSRQALWQRLAGKPNGTRFLAIMDRLSLTADFQVRYLSLQTRVWRLLDEADASQEMWDRLSSSSGRFDHPMAAFKALEDRANL